MSSCPVRVPVATASCPSEWTLTVPSRHVSRCGGGVGNHTSGAAPLIPASTQQAPTGAGEAGTWLYHFHNLDAAANPWPGIWVGRRLPIRSVHFSSQMLGFLPGRVSVVQRGAAKTVFTVVGWCKQTPCWGWEDYPKVRG